MTTQTTRIHGPRIHAPRTKFILESPAESPPPNEPELPEPSERPASPDWRQRWRHLQIAERLGQFAYGMRSAFITLWRPSPPVAANRAAAGPGWWIETPEPEPPPSPRSASSVIDAEEEKAPPLPTWLTRLRDFGVYLGVVIAVCLLGIYFLWQIPFVRDPSQVLSMVDDFRITRPASSELSVSSSKAMQSMVGATDAAMTSMAGATPPTAGAGTTPPVAAGTAPAAISPATAAPTAASAIPPATPPVVASAGTPPATASPATAMAPMADQNQSGAPNGAIVVLTAPPAGTAPADEATAATPPGQATGDPNEAVVILQDDPAPPAPGEPLPATPAAPGTTTPIAGTVAVPTPTPTPQAEVQQLLADAQLQMENRRFTSPASGNAMSTYQRVLELQPNHPSALEGLQRITTYYRDTAQRSLQQGRVDESLAYISRGLRVTPNNSELLSLRGQAQKAQERARRIQAEQDRRQAEILRDQQQEDQQRALMEEFERRQAQQVWQEPPPTRRVRPPPPERRQAQPSQGWWQRPAAAPSYGGEPPAASGFNQR